MEILNSNCLLRKGSLDVVYMMKFKPWFKAFILLIVFSLAQVKAAPPVNCNAVDLQSIFAPKFKSDLELATYDVFINTMVKLTEAFPSITMQEIGKTTGVNLKKSDFVFYYRVESVEAKPIYALRYLPTHELKGQIIITAGHHATENAGPAAAIYFFRQILESNSPLALLIKKHYAINLIPVVDVDQYSLNENERTYSPLTNNFYDKLEDSGPLWADFVRGTKLPLRAGKEAQAVAAAVKQWVREAPLIAAFDLHEAAQKTTVKYPGFFMMLPFGFKQNDLLQKVKNKLTNEGLPLSPDKLWQVHKAGSESFLDFIAPLSSFAFTFESPKYKNSKNKKINGGIELISIDERIKMHTLSLKEILSVLFNADSAEPI